MKKKIALIAIALAAIAAAALPTLASAAIPAANTPPNRLPIRDSLAIVAPRTAAVGATVQMTVFRASNQKTVAGAHVWAVTPDKLSAVRDELKELAGVPSVTANSTAEQSIDAIAVSLGRTDQNGRLRHQFQEPGRRILVAFKPGFQPDVRPITINAEPSLAGLAIHSPARAAVGEKVDVTVVNAGTQLGVDGARVWALTKAQADALRGILTARPSQSANETAPALEGEVNARATFLGTTNGAGKLEPSPSFPTPGAYVLVALKTGFRPAIKGILVGVPAARGVVIQAPAKTIVGQKVDVRVVDRGTNKGVKDAGVWALTGSQAQRLQSQISAGSSGTNNATRQSQIESAIRAQGIFLGTTNGDGKIEPQASFTAQGRYVLVAFKPGDGLGLKPILVVGPQASTSNGQSPSKPAK